MEKRTKICLAGSLERGKVLGESYVLNFFNSFCWHTMSVSGVQPSDPTFMYLTKGSP